LVLKSLLAILIGVNVALGLLLLYIVFLQAPYFNLQQVDVAGNSRLSREEVVEASELEAGINLLTVNLGEVAQKLQRHPWIRTTSVYRRLPGRIVIEIEERTPRAILAAGKLYYVDERGEVFTRLFPGDSVKYPLLSGVRPADLDAQGSEVREMIKISLALLDLLTERKGSGLDLRSVAEVRMDLDQGLALVTKSGRTVLLGKGNFAVKIDRYEKLKRFLTRRKEWHNARIIDLDFEDRALVRSGAGRVQG